ncbi:MAG: hypothetical protein ACOZQL_04575 [Myxococcota bacterium]
MKRLWLVVPLLSSLAFAAEEPSAIATQAAAVVKSKLLEPLAAKDEERSRFSRARLPPIGRTVRVLDAEARTDARGGAFVTFAVDEQRGKSTREVMTGCAYLATGQVFIKRGDDHFPAALLLGKKVPAGEAHLCHAAGEVATR